MASPHIVIQADTPALATRIEQALRAGVPECVIERLPPGGAPATPPGNAIVRMPGAGTEIDPALRHELNNHLALIRMLADYLAEHRNLPAAEAAKLREIGASADAAAAALRRSKPVA